MNRRDRSSQIQLLLQDFLDKQPQAFDELVYHASNRLRLLTASMLNRFPGVRRWEETDDVFQASMIRLHRAMEAVGPKTPRAFFGLAATQIRRELLDLCRHYYGNLGLGKNHQSAGATNSKTNDGDWQASIPAAQDKAEELIAWADFHEAIESLQEKEREVFSLIWYTGMLRKDVARLLKVDERTVLRRFNRARIELYEKMGGEHPSLRNSSNKQS